MSAFDVLFGNAAAIKSSASGKVLKAWSYESLPLLQVLKALGEDPVQRLNAREKELISENPRRKEISFTLKLLS